MMTPWHGHAPIPMRRVYDCMNLNIPGTFMWEYGEDRLWLWVSVPNPKAENAALMFVPVIGPGDRAAHAAPYEWDGDENVPSMMPSICFLGYWRGFIRNGTLIEG